MKDFLNSTKASIAIEASIIFFVLMIILSVVIDTAVILIHKDKLQRLSYQVASLVRENDIYKDSFDEEDAQKIYLVIDNLASAYIKNPEQIGVKIDILSYNRENDKTFSRGECDIQNDFEFKNLMLSDENSVVVVSLCSKKEPVIGGDINIFGDPYIGVQSVVVRR